MTDRTTTTLAPGRRGLLGGAAALLAGAAAVALPRAALAAGTCTDAELLHTGADPLLTLWRRYVDVEAEQDRVFRPAVTLRAALAARWGEPMSPVSAADLWGHDPEYQKLPGLNAESDRFTDLRADLSELMAATPATSLAGLRVKVRLAIGIWPRGRSWDETEFHEDVALATLQDADRLLAAFGEG
jgi:hypothetical protein